MSAALAASMRERTGRTLTEWVELVHRDGPDPLDQLAVRRWLKQVHGLPQNSQCAVGFAAAESAGWIRPSTDGYTEGLYAGRSPQLRALHDAVVSAALALGQDTEAQGRSTYIPVVRKTQFVAVAPGPRSTLRVGFRYRTTVPDDARLQTAKGFAQATHWLHLPADTDPSDVAASLGDLLAVAYAQNG